MRLSSQAILIYIFVCLLQGCTLFTSPLSQPVITDYQKDGFWSPDRSFGSSSLTASRRMVLFKLKKDDNLRICAEPPPLVGEELTKALSAALATSADVDKRNGSINGSFVSTLQTTLKVLEQQPKGIQYAKLMLHSICEMYMNGAYSKQQISDKFDDIAVRSERLLLSEIGGEESDLLMDKVSLAVNYIKDNETLSLKINNSNLLSAYLSVDLVVRKYSPGLLENAGWTKISNATLSKASISAPWLPNTLNLTGGELLEAALAVVPAPNEKPVYYQANGRFVYYANDEDKASVSISSEPNPTIVTVTLPKNSMIAFPNLVPPHLPLSGIITVSGKPVIEIPASSIIYSKKIDDVIFQYELNNNMRDLLRKARSEGDTVLQLKFNPSYKNVPEIKTISLSQFAVPDSPTDFKVTPSAGKSRILTWNCSGTNVTGFKIQRRKDTDVDVTFETKELGKEARRYEDTLPDDGVFRYRIISYNQSRPSNPGEWTY